MRSTRPVTDKPGPVTWTATNVLRASCRRDAAESAWLKLAFLAVAVGIWIMGEDGVPGTFSFALVGIALAVSWASVSAWWKLRTPPAVQPAPEVRRAIRSAIEQAERDHAARLATRRPYLTYLLGACITVPSALEVFAHDRWIPAAGLVKEAVWAGEWWRLLTGTFLHAGITHFWLNMSALQAVGRLVEPARSQRQC